MRAGKESNRLTVAVVPARRQHLARPPRQVPPPQRDLHPFNMTVDNALIFVHGDTATSQVIYTEYRPEKKGGPVRMTVQGKEFATWTKVKGQWLYKERYVGLSEPPAGWRD